MLIILMKSSDVLPRVDCDLAKVLFQMDDGDPRSNNLWVDVIFLWVCFKDQFVSISIGDTLGAKSNGKKRKKKRKIVLFNIDTDCYLGNVSNLCHSEPLLGYSSVIGFM